MPETRQRTLGVIAVAVCAILWGTIGPIVQLFPDGNEFQYSLFRNVTGTIILWIIIAASKTRTRYSKEDIFPIVVAGFGAAGFMPLYMLGFERTGVAVASVVSIGLAPIFVGIISWLLYKNAPGKIWALGTFLGVVGVAALNWPSGDAKINLAGFGFSALAAFSYSWQAIGMSKLSKRHNAFQTVAPTFAIASLVQIPLNIGRSFEFLTEPILLLGSLYAGIATLAVAYSLFAYGVGRIGPANAVTVGLLEPITAAAMGVTLLGEKIAPIGFVGIVLVLVGLVIVGRPPKADARILVEP